MLELFKGQLDLDYIKHKMTYIEMTNLRQARIARLEKEKKELEAERQKDQVDMAKSNTRNKILAK
jgi:hypothetical protein